MFRGGTGKIMQTYECAGCGTHGTIDEMGFLGPDDSWDEGEFEECSPFMDVDCFCIDCASERGHLAI